MLKLPLSTHQVIEQERLRASDATEITHVVVNLGRFDKAGAAVMALKATDVPGIEVAMAEVKKKLLGMREEVHFHLAGTPSGVARVLLTLNEDFKAKGGTRP